MSATVITKTWSVDPALLEKRGPLIPVRIFSPGMTQSRDGLALIDTGAGRTMIRNAIATQLGFSVRKGAVSRGVNDQVPRDSPWYQDVVVRIVEMENLDVTVNAMGTDGLVDDDWSCIFGREVLSLLSFSFDGPTGKYSLVSRNHDG